jgi:hypothetical protein
MALLKCIYCETAEFEQGSGSEEHVLLSAIGGRKASKNICCTKCNNKLGKFIDDNLAKKFHCLSVFIGVQRDREALKPVQGGAYADNDKITMGPGGTFYQDGVKQDVTLNDKQLHIEITTSDEKNARKIAKGKLKQYGCSQNEASTIISSHTEQREIRIPMDFSLDENDLRSVAKMCLTYLATTVSPERLRSGIFENIISYIQGNNEHSHNIVFEDTENEIPDKPKLSHMDHRIFLYASEESKICLAQLELFGTFTFTVLLSTAWSGPDKSQCYVINPINGDHKEKNSLDYVDLVQILSKRGVNQEIAKAKLHCFRLYLQAIKSQNNQ